MSELWVEATIPCPRGVDECSGTAQPEGDMETRYYECGTCGFTTRYQMVQPADDGTCAVGISAETRRAFPGPAEPVMLQIGRRPDA